MLHIVTYTTRTQQWVMLSTTDLAEAQAYIYRECKTTAPVDTLGNVFTITSIPVIAIE